MDRRSTTDPGLLPMEEAARLCGVRPATLRHWLDEDGGHGRGGVSAAKVGATRLRRCLERRGLPVPEGIGEGPVVLVVDDDGAVSGLAAQLIRRLWRKARVVRRADGLRAAETLKELRPDLLITDLRLPGLSGVDLCRLVREDRELVHTKILAMTGFHNAGTNWRALDSGADEYLTKPFTPDEFRLSAARLLGLSAPERPPEAAP